MKKLFGALALAALLMMLAPNGQADVVTFDTSLVSPPGFYNGSGNANSNFTVDTAGNLELGLSVIKRFIGPIDPGAGSNTYAVTTSAGPLATWNFEFSANTQAGGGTDFLSKYTYALTVQDVTAATTGPTFDAVRLIPDNSGFGPVKTNGVNVNTQWGAQNSENPGFFPFLPGFLATNPDLYKVTFSAFDVTGLQVGSVSVFADARTVPEPNQLILIFGFMGMIGIWRFRCSQKKEANNTRT